jgi:hypothetical protein
MSDSNSPYLQGPYTLDAQTVDKEVEANRAGMYALVKLYETGPCFLRTSDIVENLNAAIKKELVPPSGCDHFIFSYASSTK